MEVTVRDAFAGRVELDVFLSPVVTDVHEDKAASLLGAA